MPGTIVGIFGKQRSGKTLYAYKFIKAIHEQYNIPVYTNVFSPDDNFKWINSLEDFPLDLSPKILFLDEIYNGTDAQDYKKLKEISIFLNTIGKQNCLLVYTSIDPGMVYNRLRNQTQLVICVKSDARCIYYKLFDMNRNTSVAYSVPKNQELFKNVYYDTNFIPLDFDWNMKNWRDKLQTFYSETYGLELSI